MIAMWCASDGRVLFVSRHTDSMIVRHGILDPDVFFLQKPFTAENLARKIFEALHGPDLDPAGM